MTDFHCRSFIFVLLATSTKMLLKNIYIYQVPQQRDGEECGNFVLYFINLFMEGAPENFSVKDYPYFVSFFLVYIYICMYILWCLVGSESLVMESPLYDMLQMIKSWFTQEGLEGFREKLESLKWSPYALENNAYRIIV